MSLTLLDKTPRRPLDFYPTPEEVVFVFRDWLTCQGDDTPYVEDAFLDPTAGAGAIIDAMCEVWAVWIAMDIDESRLDRLSMIATVTIGDSTNLQWPRAHVVQNPPFGLLDIYWSLASHHRSKYRVWCATLTPVAWWNAEKRSNYVRPDYLLALGWRPSFHPKIGPAHKGSQDFCWSVLAPQPRDRCEWIRLEKPRLVNQ